MQAIAAIPGSTRPQVVDVDPPGEPGAGEVRCRTLELGICGTDRHILHSRAPMVPRGEELLVLGHECLALVEATGPGVDQVRVGDFVVPVVRRPLDPSVARPDMLSPPDFIERGIAFASGFSAPEWLDRPEFLFPVDPSLISIAVFTEPLSVAEKGCNEAIAIQRGRLAANAWVDTPPRVLVTGQGPIGFAGVLAARARDWPVTMAGRDAADTFRSQLAVQLGATYRILSDLISSTRHASSSFSASSSSSAESFDLILECTGNDRVTVDSAQLLGPCGVMCWLGAERDAPSADIQLPRMMRDAILNNQIHFGSVNAAPRDFEDALRHLAALRQTHAAELDALITSRVTLEDALWHYDNRAKQGVKVVVRYGS